MGQNVRSSKDEQYLFQIADDFLKRVTELEKLREAVQLAEAAKRRNSKRRHVDAGSDPKVIDPFAGPQLRV